MYDKILINPLINFWEWKKSTTLLTLWDGWIHFCSIDITWGQATPTSVFTICSLAFLCICLHYGYYLFLILLSLCLQSPNLLCHWNPFSINIWYIHSQWRLNKSWTCFALVCNSVHILSVMELWDVHTWTCSLTALFNLWRGQEYKDEVIWPHNRHIRKNSNKPEGKIFY